MPKRFYNGGDKNGEIKQEVRWKDIPERLNTQTRNLARKDTIMLPFGGYSVIRFIVDNPGWCMVVPLSCSVSPVSWDGCCYQSTV